MKKKSIITCQKNIDNLTSGEKTQLNDADSQKPT